MKYLCCRVKSIYWNLNNVYNPCIGQEEEHRVEIETKEVTPFQDSFDRQTSMLSPTDDHESEDDYEDCDPLEKVNLLHDNYCSMLYNHAATVQDCPFSW